MSPPTIFSFVLLLSAVTIFWGIWTMVGWFPNKKPSPTLGERRDRVRTGASNISPAVASSSMSRLLEQDDVKEDKSKVAPISIEAHADPIDKVMGEIEVILNQKLGLNSLGKQLDQRQAKQKQQLSETIFVVTDGDFPSKDGLSSPPLIEFERNGDIFNVWRSDVYIGHYLPADDTLYLYYTTGIGKFERAAVGRMAHRLRDITPSGQSRYKFSLNLWLAHDRSRPSALVTEVLNNGPLKATKSKLGYETIEILPISWMKFTVKYTKRGVSKTIGFYYADTDMFVGVSTSHLELDDLEFVNLHLTEFRANNFSRRNDKAPRQFAFRASNEPHKYTILCGEKSIGHYDGRRNSVVLMTAPPLTTRESYRLYKALRPVRAQYVKGKTGRYERSMAGGSLNIASNNHAWMVNRGWETNSIGPK